MTSERSELLRSLVRARDKFTKEDSGSSTSESFPIPILYTWGTDADYDVELPRYIYARRPERQDDGLKSIRVAGYLNLERKEFDFAFDTENSPGSSLGLPELELRKCVQELKHLQEQQDRFQSVYYANFHKIAANFLHNIEPFCAERAAIVFGNGVEGSSDEGSRIPNFWLTVLIAEEQARVAISHQDEDALSYLKDIQWSPLNGWKGWKFEFFFDSDTNPYFSNPVLSQEIHFKMVKGRMIIEKMIGMEIDWYPGKCYTENVNSFFNFVTEDKLSTINVEVEERNRLVGYCEVILGRIVHFAFDIYAAKICSASEDALCSEVQHQEPLEGLQKKIDMYDSDYFFDINDEAALYWKAVEHLLERRSELVSKYLVAGNSSVDGEEEAMLGAAFWLNAMRGEGTLGPMISELDAKALIYLKNIKFFDQVDPLVWRIEFFFNPNPYFKNSVLTKVLHMNSYRGNISFLKNTGTEIEWLPGGCLPRDPSINVKSFFNFFNSLKVDNSKKTHNVS